MSENVQEDKVVSAAEARDFLQKNSHVLPEGVSVGARGRLSEQARAAYEQATGNTIR